MDSAECETGEFDRVDEEVVTQDNVSPKQFPVLP